MCVGNLHWADSVAMMVAKHMVVSQARPYERLHLMKLLGEHKFGARKRLKSKGKLSCTCSSTCFYLDHSSACFGTRRNHQLEGV